jgi:hypothetical protein
MVIEVVWLLVRFWTTIFKHIYDFFNAEEKSVEGEIVLITGAGKIIYFT